MVTNVVAAIACRAHAVTGLVLTLALVACASTAKQGEVKPASKPPAQEGQKPAAPDPAAAAPATPAPATPAAPAAKIAASPDGTKIAFDVTGTGPALILLHGAGQTRTAWRDGGYVERLSKRFTVITMDQRGSGASDKPEAPDAYALDRMLADIVAVADAAGAKRYHVYGFGHGAIIARYLAARSDRVISAVLVGTPMGPAATGVLKSAFVAMRAKWLPLLEAKRAGTLDMKTLSVGDRSTLEGGTALSAVSLGAIVDYPPLEPAEIKAPTLWLVGGAETSAAENVKEYEGKLAGTSVTLKLLSSLSYSDCFLKIEDVLGEVLPFLTKTAASTTSS